MAPDRRLYLVTGAAGFVGSCLVRHLVGAGCRVRGMVRTTKQAEQVREMGAEAVLGDLLDPASLADAVRDVHGIYHIAALFRQAAGGESLFRAVNATGTRVLIEAAIAAGVARFVHCSTVGVHGNIENPPANELAPFSPCDEYQRSKLEGERIALEHFGSGKIRGVVIRPAMIYGPGDTRTLKLFKMVATRKFFYVGRGDSLVHFIDVRDLVRSFELAMSHEEISGESYIISGQRALPLNRMVKLVAHTFGVRPPWIRLPVRPMQALGSACELICRPFGVEPPIFRRRVDFFTKNRAFDSSKAKRELGFVPAKSIEEEIWDIISSYNELGWLGVEPASQPSLMIRSLEGDIAFWDSGAEARYGFSPGQAIGQISHRLLRTRFPEDLALINRQLIEAGIWEGELEHTHRDGSRVRVTSLWQLAPSESCDMRRVIELNVDTSAEDSHGNTGSYGCKAAALALAELQEPFSILLPMARLVYSEPKTAS